MVYVIITPRNDIYGVLESEAALEKFIKDHDLRDEPGREGSGSLYRRNAGNVGGLTYSDHPTRML